MKTHIQSKSTTDSLNHLIHLLRNNKRVYFSRFGDGEIYTMVNKDCLEHQASDELKEHLIASFTINDPLYLKAVGVNYPMEPGMIHGLFAPYIDNYQLEEYLIKHFPHVSHPIYENQILFHYLSVFKPDVMISFLNEFIRNKKIMFIGSTPIETVEKIYGPIHTYIKIPNKNAFYKMDEWFPDVLKHAHEVDVILPSAGVTSNIITYMLWNKNIEAHVLDLGSLVDAIEGKKSRKWIQLKGYKINNLLLPPFKNQSLSFIAYSALKDIWFEIRKIYKGKNYKIPYKNI
jgi:hypothetical protein